MKLHSYKNFSPQQFADIVETIPTDFHGAKNYSGTDVGSLIDIIYNQRRFETGDYYILMENDSPIACSGYHNYNNLFYLMAVRTYTWPNWRPGTWHLDIILPIQIVNILKNGSMASIKLSVNDHNYRMFKFWMKSRTVGFAKKGTSGRANNLLDYIRISPNKQIINYVEQYVADLDITPQFIQQELPILQKEYNKWKI